VGFLIVNFTLRPRRDARWGAPEPPCAVDVIAVGYVNDAPAVPRPHRIDLVIVGAVVVARQIALVLAGQALDVCQRTVGEVGRENVETPVVQGGDEGDAT